MKTFPPEHWQALGTWVAGARTQAGHSDTKRWSAVVGRSTRQLLGLERGESVGPKTIEAVASALEIESGALFAVLETGRSARPWSELRAAALEEADRAALAKPEESEFWTTPQGDDADEPVTWSHMEGRLSEIEQRILRLERAVLRVVNAQTRGGDGNVQRMPASNRPADSELSAAPDELPAAAKEGLIEEPGEFNT